MGAAQEARTQPSLNTVAPTLKLWLAADPPPEVKNPDWLSWLSPPVATVTAALIAVIGALIAYAGVTKTARTTRRENRREEKVAVLVEASAAIQQLTRAVDRLALMDARADDVKRMDAGPMKELGDKYELTATKLELYGFSVAATATKTLSENLSSVWDAMRADPNSDVDRSRYNDQYSVALSSIKSALASLPK